MVMDDVEEVEEDETDESADEEKHLSATDLPSCVIYRILTRTKKELKANHEWLHANIFHTRMILNVFINNGSGMNVIFENVMERLGLKIEKHPNPY